MGKNCVFLYTLCRCWKNDDSDLAFSVLLFNFEREQNLTNNMKGNYVLIKNDLVFGIAILTHELVKSIFYNSIITISYVLQCM